MYTRKIQHKLLTNYFYTVSYWYLLVSNYFIREGLIPDNITHLYSFSLQVFWHRLWQFCSIIYWSVDRVKKWSTNRKPDIFIYIYIYFQLCIYCLICLDLNNKRNKIHCIYSFIYLDMVNTYSTLLRMALVYQIFHQNFLSKLFIYSHVFHIRCWYMSLVISIELH